MAKKYVLKSLSVQIGGRVFNKEEGVEFDLVNYPKEEVESAIKAGFLVEKPVVDNSAKIEAEKLAAEEAAKIEAEKLAAEEAALKADKAKK